MTSFNTLEKIPGTEEPLVTGLFVDLGAELHKEDVVIDAVKKMRNSSDDMKLKFKVPYMVMDLAAPKDVQIEGAEYPPDDADDSLVSEDYELNPNVKLLVPANQIVDISCLKSGVLGGNMMVKCNQMLPAYRWFQAANLMLNHEGLKTRVVPFPMDHDQGTTYHMLPVSPSEFELYQQMLDFGVTNEGVENGFKTAARFSYELLGNRGIKELTEEQVDKLLAHVWVGHNGGKCEGILFHRGARSDFEDLKDTHFIYY